MSPMIDPMTQMIGMLRQGGSPMQIIQMMARSNPQVAQALQMIQGKSPQQLQQMAVNMARERGTSLEQIAQSLGLKIK